VRLEIDILDNLGQLIILMHSSGQSFIPSKRVDIYGQAATMMEIEQNKSVAQEYELSKTHWKALDQHDEKCDSDNKSNDVSECIKTYLETKVGCIFKGWNGNSSQKYCNDDLQFKKLFETLAELTAIDETEIFYATGCLSNCEKDKLTYEREGTTGSSYLGKRMVTLIFRRVVCHITSVTLHFKEVNFNDYRLLDYSL
jgi:hypothetical protein